MAQTRCELAASESLRSMPLLLRGVDPLACCLLERTSLAWAKRTCQHERTRVEKLLSAFGSAHVQQATRLVLWPNGITFAYWLEAAFGVCRAPLWCHGLRICRLAGQWHSVASATQLRQLHDQPGGCATPARGW